MQGLSVPRPPSRRRLGRKKNGSVSTNRVGGCEIRRAGRTPTGQPLHCRLKDSQQVVCQFSPRRPAAACAAGCAPLRGRLDVVEPLWERPARG